MPDFVYRTVMSRFAKSTSSHVSRSSSPGRMPVESAATTTNGKPRPRKDYRNRWRKARKASGLSDDVRSYNLRHTVATYLMIAGVHPFVVQDILGHSTQDMVRRYSHATRDL